MKSLRRLDIRERPVAITVVTHGRKRILLRQPDLFIAKWRTVQPIAWVLMPDHFHALLPSNMHSISNLVRDFKLAYWYAYRRIYGPGRLWQNRFWDHFIRDQDDWNRHLDYIHYNPVKHGLVTDPFLYVYSSLCMWEKAGCYEKNWRYVSDDPEQDGFGE